MKIFTGSYVGDGLDNKQISIGVQPVVVMINGKVFRTSNMPSGECASFWNNPNLTARIKDFNSTGFTLGTNADVNTNGTTYTYVAIQDTGGSDIAVGSYTGNGVNNRAITGIGFTPGIFVVKANFNYYAYFRTSNFAGDTSLPFANFGYQPNHIKSIDADGVTLGSNVDVNENTKLYYWFACKDVPTVTSPGGYTGDATDSRNVNASFQPKAVIVRGNNSTAGVMRTDAHSGDSANQYNITAPMANAIQAFNSTGFEVGTDNSTNQLNVAYQYYAWAAGFSSGTATISMKANCINLTIHISMKARAQATGIQASLSMRGRCYTKVAGGLSQLPYRGMDVMKWTKDTVAGQPSDAAIENIVEWCQRNFNLTHIGVCLPIDPLTFYPVGFTPSPRNVVDLYQKWADEVHNSGLKVLHRCVSFSMEGLSGFQHKVGGARYPAGTAADIITQTFDDDFNRTLIGTDDWQASGTGQFGNWSIQSNKLALSNVANATNDIILTNDTFTNFTMTAVVRKVSLNGFVGVAFRMNRNTAQSFNAFRNYLSGYNVQLRGSNQLRIEDIAASNLIEVTRAFTADTDYNVKIVCNGANIKVRVWETTTTEPVTWDIDFNNSLYLTGSVGFLAENVGTGLVQTFDDISLVVTQNTASWIGIVYNFIINNPTLFAEGDIFAPFPERTEGIFQDSTSFLPYAAPGIQTNFVNFFNDLKTVCDFAFAEIGFTRILTDWTANNYSEVRSGWIQPSLFTTAGVVSFDYYLNYSQDNNLTGARAKADLDTVYTAKGSKPIVWQEWGTRPSDMAKIAADPVTNPYGGDPRGENNAVREAWIRDLYTTCFVAAFNQGKLIMFNYWGSWDAGVNDSGFMILLGSGTNNVKAETYSNITMRREGWILAEYFEAGLSPIKTISMKARVVVGHSLSLSMKARAHLPFKQGKHPRPYIHRREVPSIV